VNLSALCAIINCRNFALRRAFLPSSQGPYPFLPGFYSWILSSSYYSRNWLRLPSHLSHLQSRLTGFHLPERCNLRNNGNLLLVCLILDARSFGFHWHCCPLQLPYIPSNSFAPELVFPVIVETVVGYSSTHWLENEGSHYMSRSTRCTREDPRGEYFEAGCHSRPRPMDL
jgi:hypothetical protein